MKSKEETKKLVLALIKDMAADLKGTVADIEKEPPKTRNHYDDYYRIIDQMSNGSRGNGAIVALALIQAGANKQGVIDALMVSCP